MWELPRTLCVTSSYNMLLTELNKLLSVVLWVYVFLVLQLTFHSSVEIFVDAVVVAKLLLLVSPLFQTGKTRCPETSYLYLTRTYYAKFHIRTCLRHGSNGLIAHHDNYRPDSRTQRSSNLSEMWACSESWDKFNFFSPPMQPWNAGLNMTLQ